MEDLQKYGNINIEELKKNQDNLKDYLNKAPHPQTVAVNKFANNSKYVPIGIVQYLLDKMFLSWSWKINKAEPVMNGFFVSGTLACRTYTGDVIKMDGIGAVEFQLSKSADGSKQTLTPDTLNSKAIERDVPKAEAEAFKSAAKKLGRMFGRGLNRKVGNLAFQADDNILNSIFGGKDE